MKTEKQREVERKRNHLMHRLKATLDSKEPALKLSLNRDAISWLIEELEKSEDYDDKVLDTTTFYKKFTVSYYTMTVIEVAHHKIVEIEKSYDRDYLPEIHAVGHGRHKSIEEFDEIELYVNPSSGHELDKIELERYIKSMDMAMRAIEGFTNILIEIKEGVHG